MKLFYNILVTLVYVRVFLFSTFTLPSWKLIWFGGGRFAKKFSSGLGGIRVVVSATSSGSNSAAKSTGRSLSTFKTARNSSLGYQLVKIPEPGSPTVEYCPD